MNTEYFKIKLEQELARLETELRSVGRINPSNPSDWEAVPADINADSADDSEVADSIEEFENNTAILKELEIQYNDVKSALDKIEKGTYGICEVSGEKIEEDRLEANPTARTCKKHM